MLIYEGERALEVSLTGNAVKKRTDNDGQSTKFKTTSGSHPRVSQPQDVSGPGIRRLGVPVEGSCRWLDRLDHHWANPAQGQHEKRRSVTATEPWPVRCSDHDKDSKFQA
jgi:hypothetical protein